MLTSLESNQQGAEEELGRLYVEAQRANLSKDRVIATLAHELRNPLAPIRHALEILCASDSTPAQRQHAQEVADWQIGHMARLLDDLLDVSRLKQGKMTLRREPASLAQLIHRAVESCGHHLAARQHHLTLSLPAEPLALNVDATRFHQILCNLLDNAAKYTPQGGSIRLSAAPEADGIVIRVSDNGIGIAQDMRARIFDMFAQAEPARERSSEGMGIGLSLARGLVELHGGSIDVQSEGMGKGSEFVIRLPASVPGKGDGGALSCGSAPPLARETDSALRILIVDDDEDARETLRDVFMLWGHQVETAGNGAECLCKAQQFRPDLALLDISLPEMDGCEIALCLRAMLGQKLRLVAMSGFSQPEDRARGRAAGFDHYLVKPAELSELKSVLARLPA